MKIVVLGTGSVGSVIATELLKNPKVSELKLVDIDLDRLKALHKRLGSEKTSVQRVDASKFGEVMKVAKGSDAPKPNFSVFLEVILRNG